MRQLVAAQLAGLQGHLVHAFDQLRILRIGHRTEQLSAQLRILRRGQVRGQRVENLDIAFLHGHTQGQAALVGRNRIEMQGLVATDAEHGAAGLTMKVSALISVQKLVSCHSTDLLDYVRELMNDHHIRHLPVIDDHTLVGVISMRDINASASLGAMPHPGASPTEYAFV